MNSSARVFPPQLMTQSTRPVSVLAEPKRNEQLVVIIDPRDRPDLALNIGTREVEEENTQQVLEFRLNLKLGCKEEFRLQFKWVIQSMHQNVQDTLVYDVPCIFHAIIFIIWTFMELKELLLLICISLILFCPNLESEATTDSTRDSGSGNTIRARPVF